MATVVLYAWVSPAFTSNSPVDHTFITDYDSRILAHPDIDAVKQNGDHFWYCWGKFRRTGTSETWPHGFVKSGLGSLPLATCYCEPNAPSHGHPPAQGTIATYGYDGVCHQLSNQVLWATGVAGTPLTMSGVRGYWASTAMYGSYGRDEAAWERKQETCGGVRRPIPAGGAGMFDDEFFRHATQVLGEKGLLDVAQPLQNLRRVLDMDLSLLKQTHATGQELEAP